MRSRGLSLSLSYLGRAPSRCTLNYLQWLSYSDLRTKTRHWSGCVRSSKNICRRWDGRRHGTTLASSTAINGTKEVPSQVKSLHDALVAVKDHAGTYVSLSRLQLALRGLEQSNAVVRVADSLLNTEYEMIVLGINDQAFARRLVRVLLADPLSPAASWEEQLEASNENTRRPVLLRYGEQSRISTESPLFTTLTIPSSILKMHNVEILVGRIDRANVAPESIKDLSTTLDALLSPSLEVAIPNSAQYTMLRHPVHKAMVVGRGIRDSLAMGGLASLCSREETMTRFIKIVMGLHARLGVPEANEQDPVAVVDVELASSALNKFRKSLQNATAYEHEWFRSGLPELAAWLSEELQSSRDTRKPVVGRLILSILDEADQKITEEELAKEELIARATVPDATRQDLLSALRAWAEGAHTELRSSLELAGQSKEWKRLTWWKLPWRVDDVASITSAILQQRWLVEAEKSIVWLAGCSEGAGYFQGLHMPRRREQADEYRRKRPSEPSKLWGAPPMPEVSLRSADDALSITPPAPARWPTDIAMARYQLSVASIPALQALGQRLVIRSMLTTGLSSALSGLLYVSSTGTLYEVGVVAAVGLVWSMRVLQTRWEAARATWQAELHEEGRRVLREMESTATVAFRDAGRPTEDAEDLEARRLARESVESSRKELLALDHTTGDPKPSEESARLSAGE